jgi:hypothetical protein
MENVITNENGQLRSCVGPVAVDAFRLRMIISALEFEAKTGMKMCRFSSIAAAKSTTGLKTNNKAKQIEALRVLLNNAVDECLVVEAGDEIGY